LLQEEWDDIWDDAPKVTNSDASVAKVDISAFWQIYRDVDDLFEEEEENEEGKEDDDDDIVSLEMPSADIYRQELQEEKEQQQLHKELYAIFNSISNDHDLLSKEALKEWEEIRKLLNDGLLGEDEFEGLWKYAVKSSNSQDELMDLSGFLNFNAAMDGLFEFDEDEDDTDVWDEEYAQAQPPRSMVVQGDASPATLFARLSDSNGFVGMDELKLWVELQEMLQEGDLLPSELQDIYDYHVADASSSKLTEETFRDFFDKIDTLFEDDDDDDENDPGSSSANSRVTQLSTDTVKKDLLAFLSLIDDSTDDMLPCGLDATEADQKQVLNIVNVLQQQPSNLILQKQGNIELADVAGTWELIYSCSSAMKFNKGLSGLGGSFPNGRFAGVKQELKATKFLSDMEYKERIEVNPSSASFDVSVTGNWDLRTSLSLFTGQPSIVLHVEPERVNYGPTSTRADHWKSLGPMNMLDLSYLDEDLRVMRGCTSTDTLFIFRKVS
jgi:hypothetical protein